MSMPREVRAMVGRVAVALVLATMVGGIAAPAHADNDDARYRRDRREPQRHDRDRHDGGWRDRGWGDRRPVYVSPPPPVIYAPPPPLGLELVFPIHIR